MIKKLRNLSLAFTALATMVPALAAAHVVVSPDQVGVGERQTFNVSVPNEKDSDVTQLKVVVPAGLSDLSPTVKPGWEIQTDKTGEGESAVVSAITWSGGTIPAGQRDDFTFRAQVPAKATQLTWKAYQTYADGTTVAWDQAPSTKEGDDDSGASGPYSVTKIVNDLTPKTSTKTEDNHDSTLPLTIAVVALALSIVALQRTQKKS